MARREDHRNHGHAQQQHKIHYDTIMPSNSSNRNGHTPNESPILRKQSELERAKAVR